jgi:porphobilinogen synthase
MVKTGIAVPSMLALRAGPRPALAHNVSGEKQERRCCTPGWLDEERAMLEALTSIKRAGADMIITYFAKDAVRLLKRSGL